MELRQHLGQLLDEVRLRSESIIIERAGKQIAVLAPLEMSRASPGDRATRHLAALRQLDGLGRHSPRAADLDRWLRDERENW